MMFGIISRILRAVTPSRQLEVAVFSDKKGDWVTVTVPKGRLDLVDFELSKLESKIPRSEPLRKDRRKLEGIEELQEWIRKALVHRDTSQVEEMIKTLRARYNSLEALLSISVHVVGEGPFGLTSAEKELVSQFGERAEAISYALLQYVREEAHLRKMDEFDRERGYCCSTRPLLEKRGGSSNRLTGCCEKGEPEAWEIERGDRERAEWKKVEEEYASQVDEKENGGSSWKTEEGGSYR